MIEVKLDVEQGKILLDVLGRLQISAPLDSALKMSLALDDVRRQLAAGLKAIATEGEAKK